MATLFQPGVLHQRSCHHLPRDDGPARADPFEIRTCSCWTLLRNLPFLAPGQALGPPGVLLRVVHVAVQTRKLKLTEWSAVLWNIIFHPRARHFYKFMSQALITVIKTNWRRRLAARATLWVAPSLDKVHPCAAWNSFAVLIHLGNGTSGTQNLRKTPGSPNLRNPGTCRSPSKPRTSETFETAQLPNLGNGLRNPEPSQDLRFPEPSETCQNPSLVGTDVPKCKLHFPSFSGVKDVILHFLANVPKCNWFFWRFLAKFWKM